MKPKITVLGTRGIPDVQGGVETHCQNLYPEIKQQSDADICVIARSPYVQYRQSEYKGVRLKSLWAPKSRKFEAIVHSTLAALSTLFDGSKIVHVHAVGPGLVVPLLRLLGKRVVFTHHGPDYDRQKWGKLAKWMLRLGEMWAVKCANEVIVISHVINEIVKNEHHRDDAHVIHNGVRLPELPGADAVATTLANFSLKPGEYIIAVARFVEEKGLHDLIAAYEASGCQVPLVLVGDADHEDDYSVRLKKQAFNNPNIISTGFLRGVTLHSLFSQAGLFVLPSYHEGLPIALLEAMSWSLPVIVSDIPANLETGLPSGCYFPTGDVNALAQKLRDWEVKESMDYSHLLANYRWPDIANDTLHIYQRLTTLSVPCRNQHQK
ncbi:glycosyltransferase family 4 protein [Enterobacter ludwigii]|jgi:glycosyltransferase involved in cell wall biosynthesis